MTLQDYLNSQELPSNDHFGGADYSQCLTSAPMEQISGIT